MCCSNLLYILTLQNQRLFELSVFHEYSRFSGGLGSSYLDAAVGIILVESPQQGKIEWPKLVGEDTVPMDPMKEYIQYPDYII